jgi:hypothetical protein
MRDFAELRAYSGDAVFQPDFEVIRGRARRLRRRRRLLAAGAAALLLVGGFLAYAETRTDRAVLPAVTTADVTGIVATGAKELYGVHKDCQFCDVELYASADTGATWQRRTPPPAPPELNGTPREAALFPLGRHALLWRENSYPIAEPAGTPGIEPAEAADIPMMLERRLWLSLDGGRTWRRPTVSTSPVASVADGFTALDCILIGRRRPCPLYAVDPSSGTIAPLATQPSGITITSQWSFLNTVPLGSGLWIPGLDPATRKPAVAASADGGRTWHTTVFTAGETAAGDHPYARDFPAIAAGADGLAYAVIHRAEEQVTSYRTTDAGLTWTPLPPLGEVSDSGYVTSDGAHVVRTRAGFRASRGGGAYTPVTLAGYPAVLVQLPQKNDHDAPARYLVTMKDRYWISDDGWTWREFR